MGAEQINLWSNAPPGSYAAALKQMIRSYTDVCWLHIEQASDVTHTSVRTIQRRLSAEQKTYSNLIQEVRSEMAGALLPLDTGIRRHQAKTVINGGAAQGLVIADNPGLSALLPCFIAFMIPLLWGSLSHCFEN